MQVNLSFCCRISSGVLVQYALTPASILCALNMTVIRACSQPLHALSPSGAYRVPRAPAARAELVAAIDALPAAAAPEAFGLHANADVARDCRATEALLGALVAVGAGGAGRGAPRP